MSKKLPFFFAFGLSLFFSPILYAQDSEDHPDIVHPGSFTKPPSDAIILFNKNSLDAFESVNGGKANWKVKGSKLYVTPGAGNIQTKAKFGDCQLHIEWRTPKKDMKLGKKGQGNGNSGIYLKGKYEVQVLNSYNNTTDADRQAGAIYNQHVPLANASLPPGKWQTYDIIFISSEFDDSGTIIKPGYMTVFHNGVLIQNHVELKGPTRAANEQYDIAEKELPLMLQDHSREVSFRNIWIRKC